MKKLHLTFLNQEGKKHKLIPKIASTELTAAEVSASSRIEQLTPINFEHFRSQTCSDDVSFGS